MTKSEKIKRKIGKVVIIQFIELAVAVQSTIKFLSSKIKNCQQHSLGMIT